MFPQAGSVIALSVWLQLLFGDSDGRRVTNKAAAADLVKAGAPFLQSGRLPDVSQLTESFKEMTLAVVLVEQTLTESFCLQNLADFCHRHR